MGDAEDTVRELCNAYGLLTVQDDGKVIVGGKIAATLARLVKVGSGLPPIKADAAVEWAQQKAGFAFADVVEAITAKMIRRHPHVFGPEGQRTSDEQIRAWEVIKAQERAEKGKNASLLDDVPVGVTAAVARRVPAARLMAANRPPATDRAVLETMAPLGLDGFDGGNLAGGELLGELGSAEQ